MSEEGVDDEEPLGEVVDWDEHGGEGGMGENLVGPGVEVAEEVLKEILIRLSV